MKMTKVFGVIISTLVVALCIGAVFGLGYIVVEEERERKQALQKIYDT